MTSACERPRDEATEVGPIITTRGSWSVCGFVRRAKAGPGLSAVGRQRHAFGAQCCQPTLVTKLQQNDEIVQNEVFGIFNNRSCIINFWVICKTNEPCAGMVISSGVIELLSL